MAMLQMRSRSLDSESALRAAITRLMAWPSGLRHGRRGVDATAILESFDGALIGRGVDDLISNWNSRAERSYGYCATEVIGLAFDVIVPRVMRGRERTAADGSLFAGLSDTYETQRLRKDGAAVGSLCASHR
jgi:PAS domain-containing protein